MRENNKSNKQYEKDILKEFMTTEPSSAEVKTNGPKTKNGIIDGAMLVKVRREPWTDEDNVLEVLRKGDKVTILGKICILFHKSTPP